MYDPHWYTLTMRIGTSVPIEDQVVTGEALGNAAAKVICAATGEDSLMIDGVMLESVGYYFDGLTVLAKIQPDGPITAVRP